jgi:hypothetical protein
MKPEAEYVYEMLHRTLINKQSGGHDDDVATFYDGALDLPAAIAERVDVCLTRQEVLSHVDLALEAVRKYYFSGSLPEGHLVLVSFLLWAKHISSKEACELAQLDESNFSLMTDSARSVVLRAEAISEEQRLGFKSVDEDDALEACLLAFCKDKGIRFL